MKPLEILNLVRSHLVASLAMAAYLRSIVPELPPGERLENPDLEPLPNITLYNDITTELVKVIDDAILKTPIQQATSRTQTNL